MNRRTILFGFVAALAIPGSAALAKEPYEEWIDWLEDAGYTDITASRTFLGRVQIQARQGLMRREIVINPRTGEVLRDVMLDASGSISTPNGPTPSERDRDNSGHGSDDSSGGDDHGGNSGHGGSESGGSDDHGGHGGGHGSDD